MVPLLPWNCIALMQMIASRSPDSLLQNTRRKVVISHTSASWAVFHCPCFSIGSRIRRAAFHCKRESSQVSSFWVTIKATRPDTCQSCIPLIIQERAAARTGAHHQTAGCKGTCQIRLAAKTGMQQRLPDQARTWDCSGRTVVPAASDATAKRCSSCRRAISRRTKAGP